MAQGSPCSLRHALFSHRGSQQAHHCDGGGTAEPERATWSRRHLHLHGQEQGEQDGEYGDIGGVVSEHPQTLTSFPWLLLQSPAYTLVWTRQHNGRLPSRAMDFNGILTIRNVQPTDAGTYVCTGSNMFAMDQGTATLHVQGTGFIPNFPYPTQPTPYPPGSLPCSRTFPRKEKVNTRTKQQTVVMHGDKNGARRKQKWENKK